MEPQQWQEQRQEIQHELVEHLIDRVSKDTYPSTTMLNLIEQSLRPEDVGAYVDVLMEKIRQDQYPSFALIDRVRAYI
jgi:hypothetical protein